MHLFSLLKFFKSSCQIIKVHITAFSCRTSHRNAVWHRRQFGKSHIVPLCLPKKKKTRRLNLTWTTTGQRIAVFKRVARGPMPSLSLGTRRASNCLESTILEQHPTTCGKVVPLFSVNAANVLCTSDEALCTCAGGWAAVAGPGAGGLYVAGPTGATVGTGGCG